MMKIIITDAKMKIMQSVWRELNALGNIVLESEPLDLTHPYFSLDNILVTPHFAYYTEEADNRLDRECLYSARRILNKETLVNVKNGDMLESMGKTIDRLPYGELPYSLKPSGHCSTGVSN